MDSMKELAQERISEFEHLRGGRANFDSHWTEVAERIIPSERYLFQNQGRNQTEGDKRTQELFDSTAATALTRFSSILDSLLTPRNQTWHRLKASDPSLNKIREVATWFEEVTRLLFKYRYDAKANFAAQNQATFKSLGAYGSGCLFVDQLIGIDGRPAKGLRYKNIHLSQVYFKESHQGIIDTAYRCWSMKPRQAYQKFGDKLPAKIREAAKRGTDKDKDFFFLHCTEPRMEVDYKRVDYKGMPFASYYISMDEAEVVSEKGFNSFPYPTSRYEQTSGECYGRGPAMDVLPAVKTLNEQKKTILKQGHRATDPILLGPDDGILDTVSLRPGAYNAGGVTADGRPLVHSLPIGNTQITKELMDDERNDIKDAFLVSLFQILLEDQGRMTATEVMERTREKGILLAPTIGRQQTEYLAPLIEREIDLLSQMRLLPPMPQALREAQGNYAIEYDSPLSRAQRAEEASGLMRTVESTLQVVNITQNPEPLDFFDWDVIVPEMAEIQGVPFRWMKSIDQVQQLRGQRAQQAQQQQAIQAAPGAAALMKAGAAVQKTG